MGANNSKAKFTQEKVAPKYYRPPDVRQKDRYDAVENPTITSQYDSSIDKVRYQCHWGLFIKTIVIATKFMHILMEKDIGSIYLLRSPKH